jgi:hypothetical protein
MALNFPIYMQPPNVLIQPASSGYDLYNLTQFGNWGKIVQVNSQTLSFNVDNVVFYNQQDISSIIYTKDNTKYGIIDEGKILFREA